MEELLIADAQVHVWSANTPERPWRPGARPQRAVPLDTAQLLKEMDEAGVHRAALVPSKLEFNRNDLALQAACSYPDRFVTMGRMDTEAPDARDKFAAWLRQPGMAGMRCSFKGARWAAINDGCLDWLWAAAQKSGMPVMMNTHGMIDGVERIARRYPDLKLALDHLALDSKRKDADAFSVLDHLVKLAQCPNVMVKASALSTYTTDVYPFRRLHPYIRKVYDAFGPRRIFWGTDLSRLNCSYRQAITMWTEEIPWLTSVDKEWIMGRGLCEWLDWPVSAA